jgi:hypothetical protein
MIGNWRVAPSGHVSGEVKERKCFCSFAAVPVIGTSESRWLSLLVVPKEESFLRNFLTAAAVDALECIRVSGIAGFVFESGLLVPGNVPRR